MPDTLERLAAALSNRYRIDRELGAGGMATVYLAEDLKHHREVAIKVLKPELAAVLGADRFVQEITTTAQLQHPHILPLFDSGTADGFLFYVMPYIEGETLRDKLSRETQLGVDEAVKITREVADALDYAHRHGVIHRDIKPENILLHDGRPMVADFGIALAVSAAAGGRMTETGMSLGTPHYMSPEQATADKEISGRSDVYSLASVLYEMLTGDPPHTGSSAQQIIVKIIADEARPVGDMRKSVPANVAAAVGMALEKLPADRFETAKAFADALADPGFRHGAETEKGGRASAAATRGRMHDPAFVTLAAVSLLLAVAAAWAWFRPREPEGPLGRFEMVVPAASAMFAVAPDGSAVAYLGNGPGGVELMRRDRGRENVVSMGVGEGWSPFFSPDGASIGYFTGFPGSLVTMAFGGSVPHVIVPDSTTGYGGAWGADGMIYFTSNHGDLMRVPATGGPPQVVARPDIAQGQRLIVAPDLLPGGEAAIVTLFGDSVPRIGVTDLKTGRTEVIAKGVVGRFAPPDHLLVGRESGEVVALSFDAARRVVTGAEVPIATDLQLATGEVTGLAVTSGGELFYLGGRDDATRTVVRVDRRGRAEPVDPAWQDPNVNDLSLSPDGTHLAVTRYFQGREEVWLKVLDRGSLTPLASGGVLSYRPAWSSDSRWVYFVSDRDPTHPESVYRVAAGGGGAAELVYRGDVAIDEAEVSRDGRWLAYRAGSGGGRDVFVVRLGTKDAPIPIANTKADERAPAISPDGRFVAYVSDESGQSEVYVRPLPDPGVGRWTASTAGGMEPRWSHGGGDLFYRSAQDSLVDVGVAAGSAFKVTKRTTLFSIAAFDGNANHSAYTVAPDDQSFLFSRTQGDILTSRIKVIQNWRKALEGRQGR